MNTIQNLFLKAALEILVEKDRPVSVTFLQAMAQEKVGCEIAVHEFDQVLTFAEARERAWVRQIVGPTGTAHFAITLAGKNALADL